MTYTITFVVGLGGVIVGAVAQYLIQLHLLRIKSLYEAKEKLIYEIRRFSNFLKYVTEICCDDEEEIDKFVKHKQILFEFMSLLYQHISSFESAYLNYVLIDKNKDTFEQQTAELQEELLISVNHALFCPEEEARFKIRDVVKQYNSLFEKIVSKLG